MKIKNILIVASGLAAIMLTFLPSCKQTIDNVYKGKDRIQFKYYTEDTILQNITREFFNTSTFSFGMHEETIVKDTAKIVVEFLGLASDKDRTYRVKVAADSTTAVKGVHYEPFSETQTFKAGKLKDTLRIAVLRSSLSNSFRNPEDKRLALEMVPSEDFDLGMKDGLRTYLYINNYLSEPAWWKDPLCYNSIGFYHPKKWKILISFNIGFISTKTTPPFNTNNAGRQYFQGLANYLNAVPTFDDETGDRIYIDRMVPQN